MHEFYWYKEAIIYEVHIKCFFDSANNGIGNFKGMTEKLDYLLDLGITAIWLLPFYPSPLKDDGYDIADYFSVHKQYGTLQDFKIFLEEAHRRGLKVITELVINHTSDQHPWFQEARRGGEKRNYYVWSEDPDKYQEARIIFQDFESANWSWDPISKEYYWHRFYSHQPDLNFDNPKVHEEIFKILHFWLGLGVDGVRLDAIPYLYEREGTSCENLPDTHCFLKNLRKYVDEHFQDRMLLAEANQWPEDAADYFGKGDECHMAFHFPVMPRLFMAIQLEDCLPIIEIMEQTPVIPKNCQWAAFLRNHDELTLEMVTDEERDYMFKVYANDQQARINLGIRRRLAPLLKNDRRQMELMNSLLFCLVGTPVLYYGDEIGMGDNIYLGDRDGVRTPMQWSSDRNAGFSKANPQKLYLPPIIDPEYHYETVNVEAQQNNPHSLLWWTKQLIFLRKRFRCLSYGTTRFLKPENRKILVIVREKQQEKVLIIVNLSQFAQYAELDLLEYKGSYLVELFSGKRFPKIDQLPYFITLGPYGYFWFVIQEEQEKEFFTVADREKEKKISSLIFTKKGNQIFSKPYRPLLNGLIERYLEKRLWFKSNLPFLDKTKTKIIDHITIPMSSERIVHFVFVETVLTSSLVQRYPLFLVYREGEMAKKIESRSPEKVVAKLLLEAKEGVVYEIGEEKKVKAILLDIMKMNRCFIGEVGALCGGEIAKVFDKVHFPEKTERKQHVIRGDDTTHFLYGTKVIRLFNCVQEKMHLDTEIRLFLQQRSSFRGFIPLTGTIEYRFAAGNKVIIAQEELGYPEEYSAKNVVLEEAEHFFFRMEMQPLPLELLETKKSWTEMIENEMVQNVIGHLEFARVLGKTTAEFHLALAQEPLDLDFAPKSISLSHQRSLYQGVRRKFLEAFSLLKSKEGPSSFVKEVLFLEDQIVDFLQLILKMKISGKRLRYHGQYSLENMIYTGKEFLITNFSGKEDLSYTDQRFTKPFFCDLSQMLFSIFETTYEALESIKQKGLFHKDPVFFLKLANFWSHWVGALFLRAYQDGLQGSILEWGEEKKFHFLISFFLIERCAEVISENGKKIEECPLVLLKMILEKQKG